MFKQQPPPPGDDAQVGPPMSMPEVPPARKFILRRWDPTQDRGPMKPLTVVEEIVIYAHEVEVNQSGNFVRFREYMIHPTEGPSNRVVRAFNGYLDYEEVIIERPVIITPLGGFTGVN